jgi:hypothetical protein
MHRFGNSVGQNASMPLTFPLSTTLGSSPTCQGTYQGRLLFGSRQSRDQFEPDALNKYNMARIDFEKAFQALTGNTPFPWQIKRYHRFAAGAIPAWCNLPTGLGKTAVMAIWLLARAEPTCDRRCQGTHRSCPLLTLQFDNAGPYLQNNSS